VISLSQWKSAHRARVRYDLQRRPDHCLQRRTVRLRQGRRRRLDAIATQRGLSPKRRCWVRSSPIASHSKASGLSPRAGLLCLPTLSTHGYEVITRNAVAAVTDVLTGFLRRGFAAEPSGR